MIKNQFPNPFRPGAGHRPPYLAGRTQETAEFARLLEQTTILENLVLTGLRGVGKTVLLEDFKPLAFQKKWLWAGADLSEAASLSEERIAIRLMTDLSIVTSAMTLQFPNEYPIGFRPPATTERPLSLAYLEGVYHQAPGLVADKLRAVLEFVWSVIRQTEHRGIIFAYDEAQNLSDHADDQQYPLSLLLDVFQSIQAKDIPFMLVLTGLPTLFPKLVDARTFAERMFRVVVLRRLDESASRDAILKPIEAAECPIRLRDKSVDLIVSQSGGYPYFIQFICKEVFDAFLQKLGEDADPVVPMNEITRKLDDDFFAGRWSRVTDRQRELLWVVAQLETCDEEFTVQDIVAESKKTLAKGFSSSHANQILNTLSTAGLVYKNRHGRYSLAVPLLANYIRRQMGDNGLR